MTYSRRNNRAADVRRGQLGQQLAGVNHTDRPTDAASTNPLQRLAPSEYELGGGHTANRKSPQEPESYGKIPPVL